MTPRKLLSFLLLALLALPACGRYLTDYAAIVDGKTISFDEVDAEIKQVAAQRGVTNITDDIRASLRRDAVLDLIQKELVKEQVRRHAITVPQKNIDARISEIQRSFPNPQQFAQVLASRGFTEQSFREGIRDQLAFQLLAAKIAPVTVTEADLRKAYAAQKANYEEVHARHILFSVQTQSPAQALAKAKDTVAKLRAGGDFAALAKQLSDDTGSKEAGGDLGFKPRSYFDADFARAAFSLRPHTISDPVRTQFGYHVIEVLQRRTVPFEAAREDLRAQLVQEGQQARVTEYLRGVIAKADVQVNPVIGDFDPKTLRINEHRFFSPVPGESTIQQPVLPVAQ